MWLTPGGGTVLYLLSHIILRRREELTVPDPAAAAFAFRELLSSGISCYGSVLISPDEPVFCAILFITFFLLFFTGGNALCPLPDRFGGGKTADAEGRAGGTSFHPHGGIPGQKPRSCAFPGVPFGPVCAVGMTGIAEHTALSAMLLPSFPTYIMGLLGHREECLPVRQRGDFPLSHPPDARLRGCTGRS